MNLGDRITLIPFLHGRIAFARHVRSLCMSTSYDCIAVDLSSALAGDLVEAVDELPVVSAVVADPGSQPLFYAPADPCDATIEAIRQSRQNRTECQFIGRPQLREPAPVAPLPDEYAAEKLGFDAYSALCLRAIGDPGSDTPQDQEAQYIAHRLHALRLTSRRILALVHFRHFARVVYHYRHERTHNLRFSPPPPCSTERYTVNPDHLYFALGELPFIAGKLEQERHDPFARPEPVTQIIKDLFRETRDQYSESREEVLGLSPVRLQAGLSFLRNLTINDRRFIPDLVDIVAAAKGIGGNAYALRMLKAAKYYPYLDLDGNQAPLSIGIDRIREPGSSRPRKAVNLFRDTAMHWRTLSIKPDPSEARKKKYRFTWNPLGMCSHTPEDRRIESFNAYVRKKAHRILTEDLVHSERFSTSFRDGIDIRETLRNWYTGDIYVKDLPPARGNLDTVVIIFDDGHDERYPHLATWYAEHPQESTLTFYATDPFDSMIGPGIARAYYGGLSLLFPPRSVPNTFDLTEGHGFRSLAERLVYGAAQFSRENAVAYVAARKPTLRMRTLAGKMKKHLIWVPLSTFSSETLNRLRRFHVLNGKNVRSWAARFIGM